MKRLNSKIRTQLADYLVMITMSAAVFVLCILQNWGRDPLNHMIKQKKEKNAFQDLTLSSILKSLKEQQILHISKPREDNKKPFSSPNPNIPDESLWRFNGTPDHLTVNYSSNQNVATHISGSPSGWFDGFHERATDKTVDKCIQGSICSLQ